jgi:hypothetical protein
VLLLLLLLLALRNERHYRLLPPWRSRIQLLPVCSAGCKHVSVRAALLHYCCAALRWALPRFPLLATPSSPQ